MGNLTSIAAWAASLGLSRQAGYLAVRRCSIPVTEGQVDPDLATELYRAGTRFRLNPRRAAAVRSTPAPMTIVELVELAEDIADIVADEPELMAEGLPHLRTVLALLDDATRARVRLPVGVAAVLLTLRDEARPS